MAELVIVLVSGPQLLDFEASAMWAVLIPLGMLTIVVGIPALLIAVSLLALLIPANKAARIMPVIALREE